MNKRLAAIRHAALCLPLLWCQLPAFAQQPAGMAPHGGAAMAGRHHGAAGECGMEGGGWGMMGAEYGKLDLSAEQRAKIDAIHRDLHGKQSALMGRMHDSMRSANFYRGGKFDEQAARAAYADTEKVHRQMFDNMLDARKQVDALLTPQQRQQLSQASR